MTGTIGTPTPADLVGWIPIRVHPGADEPTVDWCYTAGERFDDAFFDQTVERCLRRPFRLLFRHQTAMETVGQVAAAGETVPLSGLVFHSSRCGSTLVARMLTQMPSTVVMAEPGPLHSVLAAKSWYPSLGEDRHLDWIRWTVAALGQKRGPEQRHLVIKMDAWAVLHLPLILNACPGIPWVFLYRDPVEVLVSHLGHRGFHMIPGSLPAALLDLGDADPRSLLPEIYLARALAALLAAGHAAASHSAAGSDRPLLVNYDELPGAVVSRIAPRFGIGIGPGDLTKMSEAATHDAKNPYLPFEDDTATKRRQASDDLTAAVEAWVKPVYRSLETLRIQWAADCRTAQ